MSDTSQHPSTFTQSALKWTMFVAATALVVDFCLLVVRPFLNMRRCAGLRSRALGPQPFLALALVVDRHPHRHKHRETCVEHRVMFGFTRSQVTHVMPGSACPLPDFADQCAGRHTRV